MYMQHHGRCSSLLAIQQADTARRGWPIDVSDYQSRPQIHEATNVLSIEARMTLTSALADANAARWELARILLHDRVTGDIEELHTKCVEEAKRLTNGRDRQSKANAEAR
jgi:hypothetical protein